jgi:hypothetical protein
MNPGSPVNRSAFTRRIVRFAHPLARTTVGLLLVGAGFAARPSPAGAQDTSASGTPSFLRRQPVRLELAGGTHVPFDGDHRRTYDTIPEAAIGLAIRLGPRDRWSILDVRVRRGSGSERNRVEGMAPYESEYWTVPLCVGIRQSLTDPSDSLGLPFDIHGGFGLEVVWTNYEAAPRRETDLIDDEHWTWGGFVELRPYLASGQAFQAFLLMRAAIVSDVGVREGLGFTETLDHGGLVVQLGTSIPLN